ncbi:uncharacterized protein V6R79_008263 [Siganus canaliculatus]
MRGGVRKGLEEEKCVDRQPLLLLKRWTFAEPLPHESSMRCVSGLSDDGYIRFYFPPACDVQLCHVAVGATQPENKEHLAVMNCKSKMADVCRKRTKGPVRTIHEQLRKEDKHRDILQTVTISSSRLGGLS